MVVPVYDQQRVPCPRCGYDLQGATASWKESCPLAGRCGECGLGFAWRDLLTQGADAPRWCVEFAQPRRVPAAVAKTMAVSLLPWRFWASIRMTHRINPRRLVVYAVIMVLVCYTLLITANGVYVYNDWQNFGGRLTNTMSVGEAVARAMLVPLSKEPLGRLSVGGGSVAYLSSLDMLVFLGGNYGLLAYASIVAMLGPAALMGLVVSRRRAGVRCGHLARTFVYSLGWVVLLWAVNLVTMLSYHLMWFGSGTRVMLHSLVYLFVVGIPVFMLIWWHAVVRRYLQMEKPWVVAVSVTLLAGAGGLVAMSWIQPHFAEYAFHLLGLV